MGTDEPVVPGIKFVRSCLISKNHEFDHRKLSNYCEHCFGTPVWLVATVTRRWLIFSQFREIELHANIFWEGKWKTAHKGRMTRRSQFSKWHWRSHKFQGTTYKHGQSQEWPKFADPTKVIFFLSLDFPKCVSSAVELTKCHQILAVGFRMHPNQISESVWNKSAMIRICYTQKTHINFEIYVKRIYTKSTVFRICWQTNDANNCTTYLRVAAWWAEWAEPRV